MGRLTEAQRVAVRVRADKPVRALAAEYGVSVECIQYQRRHRTPGERRRYMLARLAAGWRVRAILGGKGAEWCGGQSGGPADRGTLEALCRLGYAAEVGRVRRERDWGLEIEYAITAAGMARHRAGEG